MFIMIAGGGRIGYNLLKSHVRKLNEVVIIEKDLYRCQAIMGEFGNLVITGDASDPATLEAAGIFRADMMVACTGNDEDNLVICQIARKRFRLPYAIALVNEPKNEEIFKRLGVDETVSSIDAVLEKIEQKIAYHGTITVLAKEMDVEIVEARLPADSPAVGKTLRHIPMPKEAIISAVIRDGVLIAPNSDFEFLAGDIVITAVPEIQFRNLKKALLGFELSSSDI